MFSSYQLFLFDFDGLLVNTEELHFEAYKRMCARRGVILNWDFNRFCESAHFTATKLQEDILDEYPSLQSSEWNVLYNEKRAAFMELLHEGKVQLMPGVADFLCILEKRGVRRCVVTHSPSEQIEVIKDQIEVLKTIPYWITREHYSKPKPDPECYQKAIALHGVDEDRIVGFEDTPRGLQALMGSRATPILICDPNHPGVQIAKSLGVTHYNNFTSITHVTHKIRKSPISEVWKM